MSEARDPRWLLLIHQIPTQPAYLRVKIWRRLQRVGAVALKNTVYVLPRGEEAQEHLQWVLREIVAGGGDASLCEARFLDGMTEDQVEGLFRDARDADYAELAKEARALTDLAGLGQLERRLAEIVAIDYFAAPGRKVVDGLVAALKRRLGGGAELPPVRREDYQGRTWVTRKNVHVDRMASAWLIRRFIDPAGKLKLVPGKGYRPARGEVRFDMYEGEFSHEGDRCTFEVLCARFGLRDPALASLAELIHDVDLRDQKFGREETAGFGRMVDAIAAAHKDDETRLARAAAVLDDLHAAFARGKTKPTRTA